MPTFDIRFEISTKNYFRKYIRPDALFSKIFPYGAAALCRAHRDPASWQHSGQKGGNDTKPKNYSNYKNDKKQVHLV